ncbi:hypothetical protein ROA7450_03312 [Roseovarius albus]|uniref:YcxB-like protein domain-containing protein n=1 Tax=Roseovarius albus TaxID=1247867 RepID=A0A1X6ZVY4_9RHOB|nr:YcxB family protein [Roseovarius albus]SLN63298.1 hypothetical protein ROA7450_03312 [Roseovarius albus]
MKEAISIEYKVTPEWESELRNFRKNNGVLFWLFYVGGNAALYFLVGIAFALAGHVLVLMLGLHGGAGLVVFVTSVVFAMVLCNRWGRYVTQRQGLTEPDIYKIGSLVFYEFDEDGFRMQCGGQDWTTKWYVVHEIDQTDQTLILRTPFAVMLISLAAFTNARIEQLEKIRSWHAVARGTHQ